MKPQDPLQISSHAKISKELILQQKGCEDFKAKPKDQKAFISCQENLFKSCYPNLKKEIQPQELNQLFSEWKKNPLYKMKTPEVHCLARARLLAKELTEKGYQVQIMEIRSPSIVGLVNYNSDKPTHFLDYSQSLHFQLEDVGAHYAVTIKQNNQTMVLDPQFAEEPMALDDYSMQLTGQKTTDFSEKNIFKTRVEFHVPILLDEQYHFQTDYFKFSDLCGWHNNQKAQKDIEYINSEFNFTTAEAIPSRLINKNPSEIREYLRTKTLLAHRKAIADKVQGTKDFIAKLESGIMPGMQDESDLEIKKLSPEERHLYTMSIQRYLRETRPILSMQEAKQKDLEKVLKALYP